MAAVAKSMAKHDELLADAHARLEQAQAVYKRFYDKHHRDVRYTVGDWVWLRLRHRAPASLHVVTKGKLRPASTGHTASQPSSTTSPTASSFHLVPGCTMCSTSGC